MNGTRDTNGTTAADNGGGFDPQEAAALIEQSKQHARRQFDPNPPLVYVITAFVILGVYGAVWLSVRGQHPYTGHLSSWAITVAVVLVVVNIGWTALAIGLAGSGVTGPAQRKWGAWTAIMVVAWIVGYVAAAPLYHAGVSHPVWGLYPASAPLLFTGLVGAAAGAVFRYWPLAVTLLGIAVVAGAAGFAGPAGSWLILGVGLCVMYLGIAAFTAWAQRRTMVRP
jgi:hypothetical protein